MAELQTAEEFVQKLPTVQLPNGDLVGGCYDSDIRARDAAVRRDGRVKALQDAAKADCWMCREGYGLREEGGKWWHGSGLCRANNTHDLIAEAKGETNGTKSG